MQMRMKIFVTGDQEDLLFSQEKIPDVAQWLYDLTVAETLPNFFCLIPSLFPASSQNTAQKYTQGLLNKNFNQLSYDNANHFIFTTNFNPWKEKAAAL